jgi:hypothetical protein
MATQPLLPVEQPRWSAAIHHAVLEVAGAILRSTGGRQRVRIGGPVPSRRGAYCRGVQPCSRRAGLALVCKQRTGRSGARSGARRGVRQCRPVRHSDGIGVNDARRIPTTWALRFTPLLSRSQLVHRVQLGPVLGGGRHVGEDVLLAGVHQRREFGPARPDLIRDMGRSSCETGSMSANAGQAQASISLSERNAFLDSENPGRLGLKSTQGFSHSRTKVGAQVTQHPL